MSQTRPSIANRSAAVDVVRPVTCEDTVMQADLRVNEERARRKHAKVVS